METTKMKAASIGEHNTLNENEGGKENTEDQARGQQEENKSFESVKSYSHKGKAKISARLKEIENEYDMETIIQMHISGMAITGILLGFFVSKRWLLIPAAAATVLAVYAMKGIAPQVPILRRLGFRKRDEINREKYSLKALRGDFRNTNSADTVWEAAQ